MAKKDLGKLIVCHECGAKFFDLNRNLENCPKCTFPLNGTVPAKPVPKKKAVGKKRGAVEELDNLDELDGDFDGEFDEELDGDFSEADTVEGDDEDDIVVESD